MAGFFQKFGISDLALGKPGLYWLPINATVGDALGMLKELNLTEISIWNCSSEQPTQPCKQVSEARSGARKKDCRDCLCVGRVNVLDVVCYLSKANDLDAALLDLVVAVLPASTKHIRHIDFDARLNEAFNLILDGVQYMVVPLDTRSRKTLKYYTPTRSKSFPVEKHSQMEFCWLTQEDVLRFFLGCIGVFSPMAMVNIQDLGIINKEILYVDINAKAEEAVPLMMMASQQMSAVAVVETEDQQLKLVGDISLSCLKGCDETAAMALATLSVNDFMSYVQDTTAAGSKALREFMLSGLHKSSSSDDSSSDEEDNSTDSSEFELRSISSSSLSSPVSRSSKSSGGAGNLQTCHPWSSLVAVMAQALAYRTSHLWVTDNENNLIGVVTYVDILNVLLNHLLTFQ